MVQCYLHKSERYLQRIPNGDTAVTTVHEVPVVEARPTTRHSYCVVFKSELHTVVECEPDEPLIHRTNSVV